MSGAYRTADATVSAYDARVITPNDATIINGTRALYVGTGGVLRVSMVSGQDITFEGVPSGAVLPIQVERVWATDTTADALIALY